MSSAPGEFYQDGPDLKNTFHSSRWLKRYLIWRLPNEYQAEVFSELDGLGAAAADELLTWSRQAESEKPVHVPFAPWGQRIDEIRVSRGWDELKNFSARNGILAEAYERRYGGHSRLVQFSKLFLFHPSSAFFSCPLAMADGAARVLELFSGHDPILTAVFKNLTSRDPSRFWTSGQWMTERSGGSDVSRTETVARWGSGHYLLSGVKWFSSSTTSEMALALARIEGAAEGSRGLTLFYVPMRLENGQLNGVEILRLKDKLGTWALPTAELRLAATRAYPVGELNQGIKTVATMLNITRMYNAVCSVGSMARGLELLADYASKRRVFAAQLDQQPLFIATLFKEELVYLASFLLTFRVAEWLGKDESGEASPAELDLLRMWTPISKLYTAKAAVRVASETVEGFGGAGYIEDTGIATLYRDAQVFSIWEGATNVLSLDLLRVFEKTSALTSFFSECERVLKAAEKQDLVVQVRKRVVNLRLKVDALPPDRLQDHIKDLAFRFAELYVAVLLLEWLASDPNFKPVLSTALKHWLGEIGEFQPRAREDAAEMRDFLNGIR